MMIIYWKETYLLHKNNETLFVATEKTGHEVNDKKAERMFIVVKKISTNFTT
jgi:hypothetical protein